MQVVEAHHRDVARVAEIGRRVRLQVHDLGLHRQTASGRDLAKCGNDRRIAIDGVDAKPHTSEVQRVTAAPARHVEHGAAAWQQVPVFKQPPGWRGQGEIVAHR